MKTHISLLCIVAFTASCTKNPPKLESNKQLVYSFKQPQRKALSANQTKHLGKPDMKSLAKQSSAYYSANGNLCRQLSNSRTVCYIGGKWYESVNIRTKGL